MIAARDPEAVLLVLPADHVIRNASAFRDAIAKAATAAREGRLATFGIVRRTAGDRLSATSGAARRMRGRAASTPSQRSSRSPSSHRAKRFLASGGYAWNSGMFVFPCASSYLAELGDSRPSIVARCRSRGRRRPRATSISAASRRSRFAACPSDLDRLRRDGAHRQRCGRAPADIGWSDVGSWSALWEVGAAGRRTAT